MVLALVDRVQNEVAERLTFRDDFLELVVWRRRKGYGAGAMLEFELHCAINSTDEWAIAWTCMLWAPWRLMSTPQGQHLQVRKEQLCELNEELIARSGDIDVGIRQVVTSHLKTAAASESQTRIFRVL